MILLCPLKISWLWQVALKMEAASNKIDIFRLKVENNEATETYAATIEIDHELNALQDNIPFEIKPYDHIVVRTTPNFEPIKYVTINGQVQYPGIYAIMKPNERLSSIIERAGGYTVEAFPEAGTFYRGYDNIGYVVTRMDLLDKDRMILGLTSRSRKVTSSPFLNSSTLFKSTNWVPTPTPFTSLTVLVGTN